MTFPEPLDAIGRPGGLVDRKFGGRRSECPNPCPNGLKPGQLPTSAVHLGPRGSILRNVTLDLRAFFVLPFDLEPQYHPIATSGYRGGT